MQTHDVICALWMKTPLLGNVTAFSSFSTEIKSIGRAGVYASNKWEVIKQMLLRKQQEGWWEEGDLPIEQTESKLMSLPVRAGADPAPSAPLAGDFWGDCRPWSQVRKWKAPRWNNNPHHTRMPGRNSEADKCIVLLCWPPPLTLLPASLPLALSPFQRGLWTSLRGRAWVGSFRLPDKLPNSAIIQYVL